MKMKYLIATTAYLFVSLSALAQSALPKILDLQARAQVEEEILEERIQTLLPDLMERSGIDLWLLISREYNEDPVLKTMLPSKWMGARRPTIGGNDLAFSLQIAIQIGFFRLSRPNQDHGLIVAKHRCRFCHGTSAIILTQKTPAITISLFLFENDGVVNTLLLHCRESENRWLVRARS